MLMPSPPYVRQFAPITGAWIETLIKLKMALLMLFAPITGAWIETKTLLETTVTTNFAPITGAWIETFDWDINLDAVVRTHHGCVD